MKQNVDTKDSVVSAAAKLTKADIREMVSSVGQYLCIDGICNTEEAEKWVPESLQHFLNHLISSGLKKMGIGQCIVQASVPSSVICTIWNRSRIG